jgi:hypothetical protein
VKKGCIVEFDPQSIRALARAFDVPYDAGFIAADDWHDGTTERNYLAAIYEPEEPDIEDYDFILPLSIPAFQVEDAAFRLTQVITLLKHGIAVGLDLMATNMVEAEDENKANIFKTLDPTPR